MKHPRERRSGHSHSCAEHFLIVDQDQGIFRPNVNGVLNDVFTRIIRDAVSEFCMALCLDLKIEVEKPRCGRP